ncbi:MAG: monofunctional biosynthetic peptidoglycan transglycosylase [Desulfobulbaceae bacterium DB1]|nr:MAG: monofunctional biosynthetic peptidoglycan transglycosylase [Desulfobulbaceae bacterium DB1]
MKSSSHRRVKKNGRRGAGKIVFFLGRILFLAVFLSIATVLAFRWLPPPTSAFMMQSRVAGLFSGEGKSSIRYQWCDWDDISPYLPLAVVAAEDQKFVRHSGFDFDSIAKAMESNKKGRRLRGASTITQQVAKNLFLWPGRSYLRKGFEAYFTVLLELLWPKKRILEVYVNIAQFGDGVYGAHAAAEKVFRKKPANLKEGDAALLAAVLPNPMVLKANKPSPYVLERRRWITTQMRQLNGTSYLRNL